MKTNSEERDTVHKFSNTSGRPAHNEVTSVCQFESRSESLSPIAGYRLGLMQRCLYRCHPDPGSFHHHKVTAINICFQHCATLIDDLRSEQKDLWTACENFSLVKLVPAYAYDTSFEAISASGRVIHGRLL